MYVQQPGAGVPAPDFQTFIAEIPEGPEGVRATLQIMRGIKNAYKKSPWVRNFANSLTLNLPQKSYFRQVERLFSFVQNQIRYVHDIAGVEMVQTPEVTLTRRSGDCDDKAVLLATLLESIGHPSRFVAVGFKPGKFSHVYVETKVGNAWIALDATEPHPPGWTPPNVKARMVES